MIEILLLGAIDLRRSGGPPMEIALRGSKRIAVLAYLAAARPRGYHRRDKLTALFWPDLPNDRARGALRTTLARLRDDLEADVFLTRGTTELSVDQELVTCDVVALDAALAAGRVDEAAELYRGDFFDGVHVEGASDELELWISAERARVRTALHAALVAHAATAEAAGDAAGAIRLFRRARALEPSDETTARSLIRLLIARGDRGSALREFDDLESRLRSEFEINPSDETERLVATLRASEPIARAPQPAAPTRASVRSTAAIADAPTRSSRSARSWPWLAAILVVLVAAAVIRLRQQPPGAVQAPEPTARWTKLPTPSGERPPWRTLSNVVLDSTGDALLMMYGMAAGEDAAHSPLFDDVWRLRSLRANESPGWTRIAVAPGPAPAKRWGFALAYDAAHDRAIMHGGAFGHSSPCANDTWILDHASGIGATARWRQVKTTGAVPPPHGDVEGTFDPASRRLVVFGGHDCFATYFSDVWVLAFDDSTLSSGRWTQLAPDTSAGVPARRIAAVSAYDARANVLYVQGGSTGAAIISDLWALSHANGVGGLPAWRAVQCAGNPPALAKHLAVFDDSTGTLVLVAGFDPQHVEHNTVWRATGLTGGASKCAWERWTTGESSPRARSSALGVVPRGSRSLVMMGGVVETFGILDLWRLDAPFPER